MGRIFWSYGMRFEPRDPLKLARNYLEQQSAKAAEESGEEARQAVPQIAEADIIEHFHHHDWVQPPPQGKLNRSHALQEAMLSFPLHILWLIRALFRAGALSRQQIRDMFYLDPNGDTEDRQVDEQMDEELRALVFRCFLYCHHPQNKGNLAFEDPGPFYFLNRNAIPIAEHLEGMEIPDERYTTSWAGVSEHMLEHDSRVIDCLIAMRSCLYERTFDHPVFRNIVAMVEIDHWYSPAQLGVDLSMLLPDQQGRPRKFAPSAVLGVRVDSREGSLNTRLPLWLQYDRGLTPVDEFVDGLLMYNTYFRSAAYPKQFPRLYEHRCPGPLLVIGEDPYRVSAIAKRLHHVTGGAPLPIYFADRQSFMRDPFAAAVLRGSDGQNTHHLLDRLIEHNRPLIDAKAFVAWDHLHAPLPAQLLAASADGRGENGNQASPLADPTVKVDVSAWLDGGVDNPQSLEQPDVPDPAMPSSATKSPYGRGESGMPPRPPRPAPPRPAPPRSGSPGGGGSKPAGSLSERLQKRLAELGIEPTPPT